MATVMANTAVLLLFVVVSCSLALSTDGSSLTETSLHSRGRRRLGVTSRPPPSKATSKKPPPLASKTRPPPAQIRSPPPKAKPSPKPLPPPGPRRSPPSPQPPKPLPGSTRPPPRASPLQRSPPVDVKAEPVAALSSSPPPPPPQPSSPPPQNVTLNGGCNDAQQVLELHNAYRSQHGAEPLVWNTSLAAESQAYATVLAKNGCSMDHGSFGENIFKVIQSPSPGPMCLDAVQGWYSEVSHYQFTDTPYADNVGKELFHFTQLVWRASGSVGCGVGLILQDVPFWGGRSMPGCCRVIVCRYWVYGNIPSEELWKDNVLPQSPPPPTAPSTA